VKPKRNQKGSIKKSKTFDQCQTPFYALDPLIPYLPQGIIWEPAAGDGHIVTKLELTGLDVIAGDILTGQNFFEYIPPQYDLQVTNPPYSIKYQWLERCYELEKPFALLLPLETMGAVKGQRLFERYGIEVILLDKRINFKMPYKKYGGGGAKFPVAWFTWGLNIGQQITFGKIQRYEDGQLSLFNTIKPRQMRFYDKKVEVIGLSINGNRTFIKYPDGSKRCVNSKDLFK
jgi:hypothetical protein